MKQAMDYLKRLAGHLCSSPEETKQHPSRRIISNPPSQNTETQNQTQSQNWDISDMNSIVKYCHSLPEKQRAIKVIHVMPTDNKKLLLLDLDKTIIYYNDKQEFVMRPHLRHFLKSVSKFYTIYIFTAASSKYLDQMMRKIQENNGGTQYISGFLTRQHCIKFKKRRNKTVYIKDLSIIASCDLSKIVIVDDTPVSYCLNPDNAVPIISYYGQPIDNHLAYLAKTLLQIKDYQDVREYIRGRYILSGSCHSPGSESTIDAFSPCKSDATTKKQRMTKSK